jgi:hypothetical protein
MLGDNLRKHAFDQMYHKSVDPWTFCTGGTRGRFVLEGIQVDKQKIGSHQHNEDYGLF